MCTNISFQRNSKDAPMISARTMDFVEELLTKIYFTPRGQSFPAAALPGEIQWKNKYAFVSMVHGRPGVPILCSSDGLNEAGLSAASLWLQCSKYPNPTPGTPILCNARFVSFVLGNFRSVDEVKAALTKLTIIDPTQTQTSSEAPLHFIISDASGNHLIVEFIDGEMKTYTNNIGVLTNDPPFDWHLTNLYNYENLSLRNNPKPCPDVELFGSGQLGSPGDPTSASRFIRAELLRHSTFQPKNTQESVGLALQILQTLAVPCGTLNMSTSKSKFDWTQWGVIRDHTNRSIYFYSAFNSRLYGIHLKNLDLNGSTQKTTDIIKTTWYVDLTNKLE
ncbi:MAG: linear amide C-N hydrolase [Clostridia bacterium]|nr:linear amide C-N hydrolase [Clostridia bacterium]